MTKYEAVKQQLEARYAYDMYVTILSRVPHKLIKKLKEEESENPRKEVLELCSIVNSRCTKWVVGGWSIIAILLTCIVSLTVYSITHDINNIILVDKTLIVLFISAMLVLNLDNHAISEAIDGCYDIVDNKLVTTSRVDLLSIVKKNFARKYRITDVVSYLDSKYAREHQYGPVKELPSDQEIFEAVSKASIIENPFIYYGFFTLLAICALVMDVRVIDGVLSFSFDLFAKVSLSLVATVTIIISAFLYVEKKRILKIAETSIN